MQKFPKVSGGLLKNPRKGKEDTVDLAGKKTKPEDTKKEKLNWQNRKNSISHTREGKNHDNVWKENFWIRHHQ